MSVVSLPPFKIGDAVAMSAGGLVMSVFNVKREKLSWSIGVKWHSADDMMQEDYLPVEMLRIAPDGPEIKEETDDQKEETDDQDAERAS